mgnify:CR=1 FL=1
MRVSYGRNFDGVEVASPGGAVHRAAPFLFLKTEIFKNLFDEGQRMILPRKRAVEHIIKLVKPGVIAQRHDDERHKKLL